MSKKKLNEHTGRFTFVKLNEVGYMYQEIAKMLG